MIRIISLLLAAIMLCGCATFGPTPSDPGYKKASDKLPAAKTAVYTMEAFWHPNVLLGDMLSFHSKSVPGTLFVTPEQLVFAVYDESTNQFLQSFSATYADLGWITTKHHGLSRIIRIQVNNAVHSFRYMSPKESNGKDADKDDVMQYVLDKSKK